MIDRELVKKIAKPLTGMPFISAGSLAALIDALTEHCEDEQHLREVVDECTRLCGADEQPRAPSIADIRVIAHNSRRTEVRPDPLCAACGGTGFRPAKGQLGYSAVRKCDCWARRPRVESWTPPDGPSEPPGIVGRIAEHVAMPEAQRRPSEAAARAALRRRGK